MKQNKLSYKIGQFLMFGGPATILFFAVVILPFFYGLYLTLTSWDGVSTTKPFVGLENYKAALADTAYWQSLGRTFIYSVIAVILTNIVAFLLALVVLPLCVPILIFGSHAVAQAQQGLSAAPALNLLGACLCLSVLAGPWAIAGALRLALEG